jgi:hypothetical protein
LSQLGQLRSSNEAEIENVEGEHHRAALEAIGQAHLLGEGVPERKVRCAVSDPWSGRPSRVSHGAASYICWKALDSVLGARHSGLANFSYDRPPELTFLVLANTSRTGRGTAMSGWRKHVSPTAISGDQASDLLLPGCGPGHPGGA